MLEMLRVNSRWNRTDLRRKMNARAGKENWFWAFKTGKRLYSWELGLQLYEDAYWNYLRKDISKVKELIKHFDVYVFDRHDIESKLDYRIQQQENEHLQDIAIRRCLIRMGTWFQGSDLKYLPSSSFSDAKVPFHLPHLVNSKDKTARSWLDNNRMIVVAISIEDKHMFAKLLVK